MCLNHVQTFPPRFLVLNFVLQITLTEISQISVTSSQLKQSILWVCFHKKKKEHNNTSERDSVNCFVLNDTNLRVQKPMLGT